MPVQIPMLQRDDALDSASVGRVDFKTPDPTQAIGQEAEGVEGILSAGGKAIRAQQVYSAQNAALDAKTQMRNRSGISLDGSPGQYGPNGEVLQEPVVGAKQKAVGADPNPVFAEHNDNIQNIHDDVYDSYKDAGPITKAYVAKALRQELLRQTNNSNTAYHSANAEYINKNAAAGVTMAQQDIAASMQHLDKIQQDDMENPDSVNPIDEAQHNIKMILGNKWSQQGGAKPVVANPNDIDPVTKLSRITDYTFTSASAQAELEKEQSKGIADAIKATLVPGQDTKNAQYMMDNYGDALNKLDKPKIQDKIAKADIDQKANEEFNAVSDQPYADAMKTLGDIENDQVRASAMKKLSTYRTQMEAAQTSQAKDNFIAAGQIVFKQQQSGKPFVTKDQALSDPRVAPYLDKLTPEQLKAVGNLVEPPDTSDPEVLQKAHDIMKDPSQMKSLSVADKYQAASGLNKKDSAKFMSTVDSWQVATPAENAKQLASMNKIIEDQMLELGTSNRELGIKKNAYDRYSPKDILKLNAMKQRLYSESDTLPILSNKDQQAHVQGMISDLVKNQVVPTSLFDSFLNKAKSFLPNSTTPEPKETPPPSTSGTPGVTSSANTLKLKTEALQRFQKAKGKVPDLTTPAGKKEFSDFIDSGK